MTIAAFATIAGAEGSVISAGSSVESASSDEVSSEASVWVSAYTSVK